MPRGNQSRGSQRPRQRSGLRELIFDGEIKPGERVAEVRWLRGLGVSRTPMRIALAALAHEGLLDALGGGEFIVRAFTYSEVVDAIELRSVLEGTAARFAAERLISEDELEPLVTASAALDVVVSDLSSDLVVTAMCR